MTPELVGSLLRETLWTGAVIGGPILGALLIAGLAVGVLQAATQINDPAVGFVPRLVVTVLCLGLLGTWMAERYAGWFASVVERIATR